MTGQLAIVCAIGVASRMEWETLRLSMDGSDGWTDHPCQCRMPNLPLCVGPAYRNRKLTE